MIDFMLPKIMKKGPGFPKLTSPPIRFAFPHPSILDMTSFTSAVNLSM